MHHTRPPCHHQLPEFTQTQVHRVHDAIQPSHPLSSPFPPAPNPSQHQSFPMSQLFAWGGPGIGVSALTSVLPKNIQDWSPLEWTGWISLQSKGFSRVFSNTTVQKGHRKICLFGQRIILNWRHLKNSKCRERLSLNSLYLAKDKNPTLSPKKKKKNNPQLNCFKLHLGELH